jgi:hypothetical protein
MNVELRLWLGLAAIVAATSASAAKPPATILVGNWQATVDVGKFKVRVITKVSASSEGKITARIDVPDQGARDIPVNAMLFNYPAVRWEIDPIGTAFNGTVNAETNQISGAFEEGPGGNPMPVVFTRMQATEEPKRVYTFADGETRDIRGFWLAHIESPGGSYRVSLKIGRAPDGTFGALLDLLDHGAKDMTASSVVWSNSVVKCEWQLSKNVFEGKLEASGNRLVGTWKQGDRSSPVSFERLDQPASPLPSGLSYTPDKDAPGDIRGYWKGTLRVQGGKLRLVFKIAKTAQGALSGSLVSVDQGGGDLPMTGGTITNQTVKLEWRAINGVFKGALNKAGNVIDGVWEQGGGSLPLKVERAPAP